MDKSEKNVTFGTRHRTNEKKINNITIKKSNTEPTTKPRVNSDALEERSQYSLFSSGHAFFIIDCINILIVGSSKVIATHEIAI